MISDSGIFMRNDAKRSNLEIRLAGPYSGADKDSPQYEDAIDGDRE